MSDTFLTLPTVACILCPWDFLGKNTGVGCHLLFQGSFSTQVSPTLTGRFSTTDLPGKTMVCLCLTLNNFMKNDPECDKRKSSLSHAGLTGTELEYVCK